MIQGEDLLDKALAVSQEFPWFFWGHKGQPAALGVTPFPNSKSRYIGTSRHFQEVVVFSEVKFLAKKEIFVFFLFVFGNF